jgi:hypothetical protein
MMIKKNKIKGWLKETSKKVCSVILGLYFFIFSIFPQNAFALTGGPSQPEVQSFEPIGTSDMVDLFSGDFVYNIPLLDVEGYPINLSYHSGVTMDQEASWVGLGWNINPGVINRGLRGIPDDFNGDPITKEINSKPNKTFGTNFGFDTEALGLAPSVGLSLGASLGISFNNYIGVGSEVGLNTAVSIGAKNGGGLTAGLGITSSSTNGASISPSVGLSISTASEGKKGGSLSLNVGSTFNSRAGLQQLSINTSISRVNESGKNSAPLGLVGTSFSFGQPTFTPQISMSMSSFSISGRFNMGAAFFTVNGAFSMNGYYNEQRLAQTTRTAPAYGYFNLENGQGNNNAMLDFNREKDGSFNEKTPGLPLTNLTYDMYSVNGQGVGGSYRGFRSDIGYVFDPYTQSTSGSLSLGGELGVGALAHSGANIAVVASNSSSGKWSGNNYANPAITYKNNKPYPDYEKYFLKEANEKSVSSDPNFLAKMGGTDAVRFGLHKFSAFNSVLTNQLISSAGAVTPVNNNQRQKREKRNQVLSFVSKGELQENMGLDALIPTSTQALIAPAHHVGEITTLNTEGARYVYGIAAYNNSQEEVTFAVGNTRSNNVHSPQGNCGLGTIVYNENENTNSNQWGVDNYFSKVSTPAYAHSYLLTAVLSPDYIDIDGEKGPSDGDLGNYTKFDYEKNPVNYKWRTPMGDHVAAFDEGLKADSEDDKASYIYGEKELWYLDKIETKNYVAVFTKEDRKDARGVIDENGKIDEIDGDENNMKLLRKISLYTKPDYQAHSNDLTLATPIKEVHFEYDYSLCTGVPNNFTNNTYDHDGDPNTPEKSNEGGKLTLKKVYFTYRNSKKGKLTPYEFVYDQTKNYPYNLKGYDRWGNYKPNNVTSCNSVGPLSTSEYPYVEQNNKATQDNYAAAWSLDEIMLPSGGTIDVEYESDDYAYVQNKKAMQMFKIIDVNTTNPTTSFGDLKKVEAGSKLYFELDQDNTTNINAYTQGINHVYFKCLMNFGTGKYGYVPGYAQIVERGIEGGKGYVKLGEVSLTDGGAPYVNPIAKTGVQYGRLYLSKYIFNMSGLDEDASFGLAIIQSLIQAFANLGELFTNPNQKIYDSGKGTHIVTGKSWLRLNNVNNHKLGGGARVKELKIYDQWASMTNNQASTADYGQVYSYEKTLPSGETISSGVAAYEPQIGGEENPWKQPVFFDVANTMVPDDKFYQETPYGESFFPTASVGYSEVTVRNLERKDENDIKIVTKHATGKVVHSFYTAKDYPTLTRRTVLDHHRDKSNPFTIFSLFSTKSKDVMTASQGYVVEVNDMHGKPKSQKVYAENNPTAISSVEYKYKDQAYASDGSRKITNNATVVYNNGDVANAELGIHFDMVSDMREQRSMTIAPSTNVNLDVIPLLFLPLPIPMVWPYYSSDFKQFRSSSTTKVVQRFGILEETIAKDLGSVVSTKNLAYDAETGEVLVTQTTTDYNDKIYTMNYPAYWYYDAMGLAYKNIGFETLVSLSGGTSTIIQSPGYFTEGDELKLKNSGGAIKGWVTDVNANNDITVVDFEGNPISGNYLAKVMRSGRRNLQAQTMASVTTLANPLNSFSANIFEEVIQASAIEYTDGWKTYCDCYGNDEELITSTNPYVLGTKGIYRPKTSYLHLTQRTQDNYDGNTNVREDGIMTSYNPFYNLDPNKKWKIDKKNWTYTSEVTEFNPFGDELENRDALGRFSAATFGFNQTMATSVAANSQYREIGFDSFEDYGFSDCADNHFKFNPDEIIIEDKESHTGYRSIKVSDGTTVSLEKQLEDCKPFDPCQLNVEQIKGTDFIQFNPINGTPTYTFDYNIINGAPQFNFNPLDNSFVINNEGGNFEIQFTYTDINSCEITIQVIRVEQGKTYTFQVNQL